MLKRLAAAALATAIAIPSVAIAGEAGDLTRRHLYEGTLAAGLEALHPLVAGESPEALFGAGLLTFAQAVEHFAQALHRHGLTAPETGPMGPPLLLPVPANPTPEPLDYQKFRAILSTLVTEMDAARSLLEE